MADAIPLKGSNRHLLLRPDYKEFSRLAREFTLMPVVKSVMADLLTPVSAFLAVAANEPDAFLLESVERGEQIGRYTFLGARPYMQVRARGRSRCIAARKARRTTQGQCIAHIEELLRQHRPVTITGLPPFTAGAVGYFAYDAVRQLESIGEHAKDDLSLPDCVLMFFDRLLAFDHLRHQIHIIATADVTRESPRRAYDRARRGHCCPGKEIGRRFASGCVEEQCLAAAKSNLRIHSSITRRRLLQRSVERAKQYIAAGDIFQVVLSQRLDFIPEVTPFDIYRSLARGESLALYVFSAHGRHARARIVARKCWCASPDASWSTGRLPEHIRADATRLKISALAKKMLADEKERAEHVMLVDLGRNDLGRVSEYGSVKVRDLMYVERYSHVMHIVSALEGKLRDGLDALDAFAACFPGGNAQRRTKSAGHADHRRTGSRRAAASMAGPCSMPISRAIWIPASPSAPCSCKARGLTCKRERASSPTPIPASEFQESMNKAQAVLRAVQTARTGG